MEAVIIVVFISIILLGSLFLSVLFYLLIKNTVNDNLKGAIHYLKLMSHVCLYTIVIPCAIFSLYSIILNKL